MERSIKTVKDLRLERERLLVLEERQKMLLEEDLHFVKYKLSPQNILQSINKGVVPSSLRHSGFLNGVINKVAHEVFGVEDQVVDRTDKGKGNKIRNAVLGAAEGVGAIIVTRLLKKNL